MSTKVAACKPIACSRPRPFNEKMPETGNLASGIDHELRLSGLEVKLTTELNLPRVMCGRDLTIRAVIRIGTSPRKTGVVEGIEELCTYLEPQASAIRTITMSKESVVVSSVDRYFTIQEDRGIVKGIYDSDQLRSHATRRTAQRLRLEISSLFSETFPRAKLRTGNLFVHASGAITPSHSALFPDSDRASPGLLE
jgi:hypothetical protein